MKVFFDTEFMENGRTIDPLSIGLVREDGAELYLEFPADLTRASSWVQANVLPYLHGDITPFHVAREQIVEFAGEAPIFWAYFADYDWVLLCQLFGLMINLPQGWPMFCMDLKQLAVSLGDPRLPKQEGTEHHALADARWVRDSWLWLTDRCAS